MTDRRSYDGACPYCARPLALGEVRRHGILHGREASRGGPYYTLDCPRCRRALEAHPTGRTVRITARRPTRQHRLDLRALWSVLLGRAEATGSESVERQRVYAGRTRGPRARPQAVVSRLRTLGLPPDADFAQVRRAFLAIVRENHPDVTRSLPAEERGRRTQRFREALEAYRELERRRASL